MPASAVYYFPLPILSFISAAARAGNSPWQQGAFYPVRLRTPFPSCPPELWHSDASSRIQQGACSWQGSFPRLYCSLPDKFPAMPDSPPAPPPLRALLKLPPGKFWRASWPFFTSSWQRRRQAGNGTPFSFPPAFWRQPSCCSASVFSGDTRFPAPDCRAGWPWVWEAAISLSGHGFPPGFIMRA